MVCCLQFVFTSRSERAEDVYRIVSEHLQIPVTEVRAGSHQPHLSCARAMQRLDEKERDQLGV